MRRLPAIWIALAALATGAIALGLLAYFSVDLATNAVRDEVAQRIDSTAAIGGTLVQSDVSGLTALVESYASRPFLIDTLGAKHPDPAAVESQLRGLRAGRPGIATTFLAAPNGRLIDIVPATPEIVGNDFSFRDWYRGVRRTGRLYVSRAYLSSATGHPRVVAAAAPVRARRGGRVLGILVAAYGLDHVQNVVDKLSRAQDVRLVVTDQHGVVLAGPGAKLGLVSRRRDPSVMEALAGRSGIRTVGPRLTAYRPVPSLGWTITSEVPTRTALSGIGPLRTTVATVAALLALLLLGGAAALARTLRRRDAAEAGFSREATINAAILDRVRDGIAMMGADGRAVFANARMRELMDELYGEWPEAETVVATQEQIASRLTNPAAYLEHARAEREDPDVEIVGELEIADSRRSFVRYSAPVRDTRGERLGRLIVLREVTAERTAEQMKTDLVATVSHELRTPLTGVLGFADLLRRPGLDEATRERYASTVHTEALRLTKMVNDFLDLQRIEAGGLKLSLEVIDLTRVLEHAVDVFRGQSERHRIELDVPDGTLDVAADAERIGQVAANLLSNAIKYSPEGGTVLVTARSEDGAVRVSVRDPGIGIPESQQRRLFSKFFRVDSSDTRSIGGTGLGLALAREIVESHGGQMGFQSVEGVGSTFWFELPSGERQPASARVLVVEDDPGAAELLVAYLSETYDVEVATSGVEALERVMRRPPAVVCLDIGLPGAVSGWQVLARLKSDSRTAHVPVVVCTGANGRRRAAALGAADFLTKPFTREALLDTISSLLPDRGGDVLVVDDDATLRKLVGVTLAAQGHEIREAADGEEALTAIAEARPDAIVLDLVMPKLDGFAVLERLQESPELRTIPVLVLTARRLSKDERQMLRTRATSLLEKSDYSPEELRDLVARAVGA